MPTEPHTLRLLAASGYGQQVIDLCNGMVRLDTDAVSLLFTCAEFGTLAGMIEAARYCRAMPSEGLLTYDGARCAIVRCGPSGALALVVERTILRLPALQIAAFTAMCRRAVMALRCEVGESAALAWLQRPHRLN